MTDNLDDIVAQRQALQNQISALTEKEHALRQSLTKRRYAALTELVNQARALLADPDLQIAEIEETSDLTENLLIETLMFSGNKEVAVQVYSAYERKGYLSTNDRVDAQNQSYRDNQAVVVSFVIPRGDLQEALAPLEKLEKP